MEFFRSFHFQFQDLPVIGVLVFLEIILSVDNALVLAILAKDLPEKDQKKALMYGIWGAIVFRVVSIWGAQQLLQWNWVKFVGGGYLVLLALKNLIFPDNVDERKGKGSKIVPRGFWWTVLAIELTDIAFAIDSILAAIALTNKMYLVLTGGVLGLLAMRVAAGGFLKIIKAYPRLERAAFWLVLTVGIKVILEGLKLSFINFHSATHPSFWVFWATMAFIIAQAFQKK